MPTFTPSNTFLFSTHHGELQAFAPTAREAKRNVIALCEALDAIEEAIAALQADALRAYEAHHVTPPMRFQ